MRKYLPAIIPLVIFFGIVALLSKGLELDPRKLPSPLIGQLAPKFQLQQLQDPNKTLSNADFTGRVVLLNVWASWCVSCRYEHPVLMQLAHEVPIYSLNYKDQREDALATLHDDGDPYIATAFDADGRVGIDWGVYGTPETFIIDQQGRVRYKHTGPISEQDVQNVIRPWLKKLREEHLGISGGANN